MLNLFAVKENCTQGWKCRIINDARHNYFGSVGRKKKKKGGGGSTCYTIKMSLNAFAA